MPSLPDNDSISEVNPYVFGQYLACRIQNNRISLRCYSTPHENFFIIIMILLQRTLITPCLRPKMTRTNSGAFAIVEMLLLYITCIGKWRVLTPRFMWNRKDNCMLYIIDAFIAYIYGDIVHYES